MLLLCSHLFSGFIHVRDVIAVSCVQSDTELSGNWEIRVDELLERGYSSQRRFNFIYDDGRGACCNNLPRLDL